MITKIIDIEKVLLKRKHGELKAWKDNCIVYEE